MPTEQRTQHPFYMYEAILEQPEAFAHAISRNETVIEQFVTSIAFCERLFLVGIGTSYHAAQVGEHLMRIYGSGLTTYTAHSFDFALYGPPLNSKDCVIGISHRGNKFYTLNSLKCAHQAGCYTALIAGEGVVASGSNCDFILHTVTQEKSSAHTVSYVGAIAILASLSEALSYYHTSQRLFPENFLDKEIPKAVRVAFETESQMAQLARKHLNRRRVWLVGGGPNAVTANEIALKIKETSYVQAEGISIEAMFHGPFQCAEAEDLFIIIAPAGKAQVRALELIGLVKEIGATYLLVSDETQQLQQQTPEWCIVPQVPEPLTALTCLVPLQLFTYYLALEKGTNPDRFRLEDPRFARARQLVEL